MPSTKGIAAGDPAATDPATYILSALRPLDGNDDGKAVRDQGAYEYGGSPGCVPDVVAPKLSKVRKGKLKDGNFKPHGCRNRRCRQQVEDCGPQGEGRVLMWTRPTTRTCPNDR